MAYFISTQIIISILLNYFIIFAMGFPVWKLDGPIEEDTVANTNLMEQSEIPKPYIRLAGACIGLLIIGLLALSIRFCNKHVKALKRREEEVRHQQVFEEGVKICIREEENKETPNKENKNKVKEVPGSATIIDVPEENCAEIETQHVKEASKKDTAEKQKKKKWRKYLSFIKKRDPPPKNCVETDKELQESEKKQLDPELAEEAGEHNSNVHQKQEKDKKKKRIWKWKWKKKRAETTLLP